MSNIIVHPTWQIPERFVTPESAFFNRRRFLKQMGFAGAGLLSLAGCSQAADQPSAAANPEKSATTKPASASKYPAKRNPGFNPSGGLITKEEAAASLNNFYEFFPGRATDLRRFVNKFVTSPWPVQFTGLIEKPVTLDVEEIAAEMPLEERVYRFRCVEAWAMIVPWTGFPLSKLIEKVAPKPEAKFLRFETFNRPDQAPGITQAPNYPWPYFEGLRMDEAMHPLTMVVTGIYGKPLPKQHGAPIRIIVPWKYGYKSIKSIVKMEFVEKQPKIFWEVLQPSEYPFESNVDPAVPHPRWSQATERLIDTGDRVPTLLYNGYGEHVAKLYAKR